MKVHVKAYAKINLSLAVTGTKNGYHMLDSLVTTIDLFDKISLSSGKDGEIGLVVKNAEVDIPKEKNNAYKAIKLYSERFRTGGANMVIRKGIPFGGGLGGSSADVAGALLAMEKLYRTGEDLKPLADELGSDSGYLLGGGFARLTGRGDIVEPLGVLPGYYVLLLFAEGGVSTPECFRRYDETAKENFDCDNRELASLLLNGDLSEAGKIAKNVLTDAAVSLNGSVGRNLAELKALSPSFYGMSGSGGTTFALYEDAELARWAADKLRKKDIDCLVTRTIDVGKNNSSHGFMRIFG